MRGVSAAFASFVALRPGVPTRRTSTLVSEDPGTSRSACAIPDKGRPRISGGRDRVDPDGGRAPGRHGATASSTTFRGSGIGKEDLEAHLVSWTSVRGSLPTHFFGLNVGDADETRRTHGAHGGKDGIPHCLDGPQVREGGNPVGSQGIYPEQIFGEHLRLEDYAAGIWVHPPRTMTQQKGTTSDQRIKSWPGETRTFDQPTNTCEDLWLKCPRLRALQPRKEVGSDVLRRDVLDARDAASAASGTNPAGWTLLLQ
eukprot:gene16632-biopygen10612